MLHELKCEGRHFNAIWQGKKLFEYRLNDRNYLLNDILLLKEYFADNRHYTGRALSAKVSFILKSSDGFDSLNEFVIMSLSNVSIVRT